MPPRARKTTPRNAAGKATGKAAPRTGGYLCLNDLHLSKTPPQSCTDSYLDDLFDLLRATVDVAARRGCAGVLFGGDVFHHKNPLRTPHAVVARFIETLLTYPCPVWIVPGNHDMQHDRYDSIDETQPLGVVFASGAAKPLHGWLDRHDDLREDSTFARPLYGVPWLQRFTDETVTDALAGYRDLARPGRPALVVAHAPLYPTGLENEYENYPAAAWAAAMGGEGSVFHGHVHEAAGIHTAGGVTFCNPGALSRGSLHEHNLSREISCALWHPDDGSFEIVALPHRPAAEVFRLDDIAEVKDRQADFDDFLASIAAATVTVTTVESVMAAVREMDLPAPVVVACQQLLEGVT